MKLKLISGRPAEATKAMLRKITRHGSRGGYSMVRASKTGSRRLPKPKAYSVERLPILLDGIL